MNNQHSHWMDPAKADPNFLRHREQTAIVKRRFFAITLFNLFMVALLIGGIRILVKQSSQYPDILVKTKDSGVFFAPGENNPANFDDEVYTIDEFIKIIELAYLRAGNQEIPGSEYYLSDGVYQGLNFLYETPDMTFGQRIAVNPEGKFIAQLSSANQIALFWEAQIFSRGLAGMQSSTIYIATLFQKGNPTKFNPTGWVLFELTDITKSQFDSVGGQQSNSNGDE